MEAAVQTLAEAEEDPHPYRVRVGEAHGWSYAVEGSTAVGGMPDTLAQVSAFGEAASLCLMPTVQTLLYARAGQLVSGIDLVVTNSRYGVEPYRFDSEIRSAGLLEANTDVNQAGALLLTLVTGFTVEQPFLEGPLLSGKLPNLE